jgi:hypothetical protein
LLPRRCWKATRRPASAPPEAAMFSYFS